MAVSLSLSPFQREKLEYYFNLFDSDGNGTLELCDLDGFMKKVLEFTGWPADSQKAKECYEVHECFFHTLTEKAKKKGKGRVSLSSWLALWEGLIPGCMSMLNFPIWVRLLPKCLFRIIDQKEDGRIDEKELSEFYMKFVGIKAENVTALSKYAMQQWTDDGRYPLTMDSYMQMFANFLIGKTPYGPGRLIFGCFEHMVERTGYQLIQGPPEHFPHPELSTKMSHLSLLNSPATPTSVVKVKYFRAG